jgi:hypothetical protein
MIQIKKNSLGRSRNELAKDSTILADGNFKDQLLFNKILLIMNSISIYRIGKHLEYHFGHLPVVELQQQFRIIFL